MAEKNYQILIVDDDESARDLMSYVVEPFGRIDLAEDGAQARKFFQTNEYHIVFLDYMLPDTNGLVLLKEFKELQPLTQVIMITHVKDLKVAVEAMKHGAYDYINKDYEAEELKSLILRAIEKLKTNRELLYLRAEVDRLTDQEFILGNSSKMKTVKQVLDRAASTTATVLIQGESGTGKELVARYLHKKSPRNTKPFVAINMASVPDNLVESTLFGSEKGAFTGSVKTTYGKFELADSGTLFCDEIGELKLELQAKLLRSMQEGEIERVGGEKPIHVDVRIVAATNRDLKSMVKEGNFREDLYYRLNVIPICLPSLKERIEDIPSFVELFLNRYNRQYGRRLNFSPEALNVLAQYNWPGNIRELENLIARLVAIHPSEVILPEDIPIDYQPTSPISLQEMEANKDNLKSAVESFERGFILRVLEEEGWHQEKAAERMGCHRKTLAYKLGKLNLTELVETNRKERSIS